MSEEQIGSPEWRQAILEKIARSSKAALTYECGQLARGDAALERALGNPELNVEGVNRLVWDQPQAVPGAVLWIHPAWSSLNGSTVRALARKLAKQLNRTIWWAKDEKSKWEVLAYQNPEKHGMKTDFIATVSKAGRYTLIGAS